MPAQGYIRLDYLFHRQNKTITMKLIVKLFILDSFIQTNRVSDPLIVSPLISPYISVGLHQILLQGLFLCSDSSWCFSILFGIRQAACKGPVRPQYLETVACTAGTRVNESTE